MGESCYVYIDDVITFSDREDDHVNYIAWVCNFSREKFHFLKKVSNVSTF